MKKPHVFLLLALVMSIAAASAYAAAPKKPAAPAAPREMRVTVTDDGDAGDDMEWTSADGDDAGGRHVIVRRIARGGGMGPGECDMSGPGGKGAGGCGMDCGMGGKGRGMSGHMGPGRGRGMGHGEGMGPGGPGMGMMFGHLDLSDAQKEKMRDIHERQMRRDIQAKADLEIAKLDMHKLMSAEKPDGAAINAQIDRVAKLRTDMQKARVATMLEARSLLTPEQQKKARELHMNGGPGGHGGPGMGMGMGPGGHGGPGMGMGMGQGMGPGGMHGMGMGEGQKRVHVKVVRDTVGK